jgi:hypothetical protein
MTSSLYLIQVVVVTAAFFLTFQRAHLVIRLQILAWSALITVVYLRYGLLGQAEFYSNDQRYYVSVVEAIILEGVPLDVDWWLSASRIPYTMPAALLALTGIAPILALKIISLVYLLLTTHLLIPRLNAMSQRESLVSTYLLALGGIGIFFSSLALRETSMMFFVAVVFTNSSLSNRLLALTTLTLLRPHLAAAILIGYLMVFVLRRRKGCRDTWSPINAVFTMIFGPVIGYVLFSIGFQYQTGVANVFGHAFGLRPVTRIASNFVGLQFVTSYAESLEFPLSNLLLARLLFSETILIPFLLTTVALSARRFDQLGQWTLWSFAIYVGLVTNTEFNSFRQNVPLMPMMGFVVFQYVQQRIATRHVRPLNSFEMSS